VTLASAYLLNYVHLENWNNNISLIVQKLKETIPVEPLKQCFDYGKSSTNDIATNKA
jgi:hypothetical protein